MRVLSGQALLRIWEVGQGQHPVDRALTILRAAFPERSWQALAELSIGQRDGLLLTVYENTFGEQVAGLAHCPPCQEALEFSFRVADIRLAPPSEPAAHEVYELSSEGYQLRFRLPNSFDLGHIAGVRNVIVARQLLLQRCVIEVHTSGESEPVDVEALPAPVVATLISRMAEYDPQAELEFNFVCSECGHQFVVLFDIVAFLWPKISAHTKRLLTDVHRLARAYGWREADILSMSAVRRQLYLEMVS